jgi:hypothetical protein
MITLIFYPEEKKYIDKQALKAVLNCAWIQRTDKAMAKYEHIAITFDEKQRNNLNNIMQEMIKFVFDFNWEF